MGLFKDDAGKTEKATPGKLQESRTKGQTALSKELTMSGILLMGFLTLEYTGSWFIDALRQISRRTFDVSTATDLLGDGSIPETVYGITDTLAAIVPPLLFFVGVLVFTALVFGYGQIGFKFSSKALDLKPEKLNPVTNLGTLFRFSQVFKAILSLAKLAVLGLVLYLVLRSDWGTIAHMHDNTNVLVSLALVGKLVFRVFFWISFIVFLLSLGDLFWQRYDFAQRQKMTKQEVEDERKRDDGDPMVKSRMRSARAKLVRQRMMDAVPKADVIITNPTHVSVALRYSRDNNRAPEVTAKGVGDLALRIRELALEHDVPLMEDPPLARALYRAVDVGEEIPEKFYQAVATVLGHVYRLRGRVA